ncbi:hypothetical protein PsorP6_015221 [Peronosclerospora sorghi]|uniref:Uncharacterized protein n=1 Tax=Peronosclerospora sorghi TaxID=230839 RepID=A0ACC0VTB1_9STRA|nr:hypothetical protein PsorP6_015221 [Peronosclerospora sorghi]
MERTRARSMMYASLSLRSRLDSSLAAPKSSHWATDWESIPLRKFSRSRSHVPTNYGIIARCSASVAGATNTMSNTLRTIMFAFARASFIWSVVMSRKAVSFGNTKPSSILSLEAPKRESKSIANDIHAIKTTRRVCSSTLIPNPSNTEKRVAGLESEAPCSRSNEKHSMQSFQHVSASNEATARIL